MEDTAHQNVQKPLDTLKHIEKVFATDHNHKQTSKKQKANLSNSNNHKMVSFTDPIPKKNHQDVEHYIFVQEAWMHACH